MERGECGVKGAKCEMECEVSSVKCSLKCAVPGVQCELWSVEFEVKYEV